MHRPLGPSILFWTIFVSYVIKNYSNNAFKIGRIVLSFKSLVIIINGSLLFFLYYQMQLVVNVHMGLIFKG